MKVVVGAFNQDKALVGASVIVQLHRLFVYSTSQDPATKERLAAAGARPVSAQQGARLARQIRAEKYLETSAATDKAGLHCTVLYCTVLYTVQAGLAAVFEEAVLAVLRPSAARSRRPECRLL